MLTAPMPGFKKQYAHRVRFACRQNALGVLLVCMAWLTQASGQGMVKSEPDSLAISAAQQRALQLLSRIDTTQPSGLWPHIHPALLYTNLRNNVLAPLHIYQGKATNFCGQAAITYVLVQQQPQQYVAAILSLYYQGYAYMGQVRLEPSPRIRRAAGTLRNKRELDLNHADQLWFLAISDHYKGYINVLEKHFDPGDENGRWAATNLAKFNRMLAQLGGYTLHTRGSDLIRPSVGDVFQYTATQQQRGLVLLYLNSKYLHPNKLAFYKVRLPTHFVVLYEWNTSPLDVGIKYWDYGLKTIQVIPKKQLQRMIYGITTILPNP